MEKSGFGSKQKGVCEKLFVAIRTASPFRTTRFSSEHQRQDADIARANYPNLSVITPNPVVDRCARVSKQSLPPADNKKNSEIVPVSFDTSTTQPTGNHFHGSTRKDDKRAKAKAKMGQEKVTMLPIQGHENKVPSMHLGEKSVAESMNGMFSEYIDRVGRKIRTPSNVGGRKASLSIRRDSFNDKVSDFINRAKNKLHNAPSFVEAGKTASFKESGAKERRFK